MINPTDSTWSIPSPSDASDDQARLAEILDAYLQSLEDGIPIDPELLISQHPDLEHQLREYLDGIALLNDGIGEFRNADAPLKKQPTYEEPRILGDYQIIKEIGRGGMGVVYEARQISLDRQVALKVLPFASMLDQKQVVRFQNEARAAAQLHHPNIVPIHGVGRERGVNYYAMQFISGHSLRAVIDDYHDRFVETQGVRGEDAEDTKRTDAANTTNIVPATATSHQHPSYIKTVVTQAIQAAQALATAHDCGVIHRDIKPSNLLLDEEGKLWVTDFGLARIQSDASFTQSGDILGTLNYMSPEQAAGNNALTDHRTDIYSLGVTLYELLTLHRAFQGQDHGDVTSRINEGNFKRLRSRNSAIPPDLENVVLKAMATAREDRYQSANDLAEDLSRFLKGIPTRAKKPTPFQRLVKWTKRRRRIVSTIGVVAVLALVGVTIGSVRFAQERNNSLQVLRDLEQAKEAVHKVAVRATRQLENVPGTMSIRVSILSEALNYQEQFLDAAKDFNHAGPSVAETHAHIAMLYSLRGDRVQAIAEYEIAEAMLEELTKDTASRRDETALLLTSVRNNRGLLQRELGNLADAREAFEMAIDCLENLEQSSPETTRLAVLRRELATSWNNLGLLNADEGFTGDAASAYQSAKKTLQKIGDKSDVDATKTLASVYNNLSQLYAADKKQAISWAVKAIETLKSLDANAKTPIQELANYHNNLASLYSQFEQPDNASENYREAIDLQKRLLELEPYVSDHKRDLAVTFNNQGLLYFQLGELQNAKQSFESAFQLQSELVKQFPTNLRYANQMGGVCNNIAMIYSRLGQPKYAERAYSQGIKYLTIAYEESPNVEQFRNHLSRSLFNFCNILLKNGKTEKAIEATIRRREMCADDANQLFSVAVDLTRAFQQFQIRPPNDGILVTNLVRQIEITLDQAVAAGWQVDTSNLIYETFKENPILARFFSGDGTYQ